MQQNKTTFTAVILNPESEEAQWREKLEDTRETIKDILTSAENFKQLFSKCGDNAKLRKYNKRPFVWAVVTRSCAFEQRYRQVPPRLGWKGCFGDLTPVFRFNAGTNYYQDLVAELSHVIEHESDPF